ncbi:hypothetical protein DFP92_1241 [Yoonia sediminilitoris]|uniref:Uncharacterized protein n=1 Tax=Yoonia sediminilitoris TaxID=1286148 RepID=A0A2T6K5G2_9RHOB|nr:hypothetical protein C8N45_1241 [Yoonia sediminilitoris]RCW89591.1 hypothetical protein DFP92_1241 [Yoonia sediminilitoris]
MSFQAQLRESTHHNRHATRLVGGWPGLCIASGPIARVNRVPDPEAMQPRTAVYRVRTTPSFGGWRKT